MKLFIFALLCACAHATTPVRANPNIDWTELESCADPIVGWDCNENGDGVWVPIPQEQLKEKVPPLEFCKFVLAQRCGKEQREPRLYLGYGKPVAEVPGVMVNGSRHYWVRRMQTNE